MIVANSIITHKFRDHTFYFTNTPMAAAMINEIFSDNYKVLEKKIDFQDGDIILDLGACEGMFSIMMMKLFPQARIVAIEPVPRTFYQMIRNIGLNGVNIEAYNIGVGKQREKIIMIVGKDNYSGGSSGVMTFNPDNHIQVEVDVIGLDEMFELFKLDRVRLLKIDIEGMEYDTLYNSTILSRVDYLTGEFHINGRLDYDGRRIDGLINWVSNRTEIVHIETCRMAE